MACAAKARRSAESAATTPPSESAVCAPAPICARNPSGDCASALHWGGSLTRSRPGGHGRARATGDWGKRFERLGCGCGTSRATIAPVAHAEEITSKARSIGIEGIGCRNCRAAVEQLGALCWRDEAWRASICPRAEQKRYHDEVILGMVR